QANEYVGLPESAFALSEAAIYLSLAPKSNAIARSMTAVREDQQQRSYEVPAHLKQGDKPMMRKLAREGKGYKYPHDESDADQDYRPPELEGKKYWDPDRT